MHRRVPMLHPQPLGPDEKAMCSSSGVGRRVQRDAIHDVPEVMPPGRCDQISRRANGRTRRSPRRGGCPFRRRDRRCRRGCARARGADTGSHRWAHHRGERRSGRWLVAWRSAGGEVSRRAEGREGFGWGHRRDLPVARLRRIRFTDLTRVKSVRACLPPAGAMDAPARQARPDCARRPSPAPLALRAHALQATGSRGAPRAPRLCDPGSGVACRRCEWREDNAPMA